MAFSAFTNRLPDPNWTISEAGEGHASSYTAGPGFASVKFTANQPVSFSRTNSGRVTTRSIVGHHWSIGITYNPMTREQFEPIYNFLLEKRGRLKPFFVVLPQNADPRTTTSGTISVQGSITSGDSNFLIDGMDSVTGGLRPGDMFNFSDSSNSNHLKIYKVVRVADSTNKLSTDTALNTTDERRLYVVPPVEKDVADNSTLTYSNPMFRVVQKSDVQEYSLGTNNLYTFSLNLEEAQA
jgi:hypothetical protein